MRRALDHRSKPPFSPTKARAALLQKKRGQALTDKGVSAFSGSQRSSELTGSWQKFMPNKIPKKNTHRPPSISDGPRDHSSKKLRHSASFQSFDLKKLDSSEGATPVERRHRVAHKLTSRLNKLLSQKQALLQKVVTQVPEPSVSSEEYHKQHLRATYQALRMIEQLPPVSLEDIHSRKVNLPRLARGKKTIVFDLDETLVHCCEYGQKGDLVIPIPLSSGEEVLASVNVRPFAKHVLNEAKKLFEVIVFTASEKVYADAVLDQIDPYRQLIDLRLYRETCVPVNGMYIKDLRVLENRLLKNIVIVDNAAYSFANQLANGVPIISWYNDPHDKELLSLVSYLHSLARVDDVRTVNLASFDLPNFVERYRQEFSLS